MTSRKVASKLKNTEHCGTLRSDVVHITTSPDDYDSPYDYTGHTNTYTNSILEVCLHHRV